MYEVELKFPLVEADGVLAALDALQARQEAPVQQRDRYFNHPARDFARTDEALRLRSSAGRNWITYKGPLIDPHSKTRREIDVPYAPGEEPAERMAEMLALLGFREVRSVSKTRTPYRLDWEGRALEVALDQVAGLGTFLEIETLADEAGREAARDSILRLASRLQLEQPERRSYLRLLIEAEARC